MSQLRLLEAPQSWGSPPPPLPRVLVCIIEDVLFSNWNYPSTKCKSTCSMVSAEGGISPFPSNSLPNIRITPNVVTLDVTALNSTVWLTCYRIVNVTVPIPASARNKASIKYEENYSTAGMLPHSTSQVNHCTQQLTLKGSCSAAWDTHHLQKGWPQEIPIPHLQSCTTAIGNGWWHMLTFLSCRSAGKGDFSFVHCSIEKDPNKF